MELFFLANLGQHNVLCDILERKHAFLGYKNKRFKKSKNWHFFKGVNPWIFSQNGHFFNFFFLSNIGYENDFSDILERKIAFLFYKKWKNWHFSKGVNARFWSKNAHFSNFFFLGNIGLENFFYDILERENAFLGYKNEKFKKSENWYFSKGVNPWIFSKNGLCLELFLSANLGQQNVLCDILERKHAFLAYKNNKFKKSKNWHFS